MMAMANNLLGGFGAGFNSGQSAANDIADSRRRNQLASLASQAYSTPEGQRSSLLGQMAAIDPGSAQAQGEAFESEDVRRVKKFENMARLLTSAPEQYREGIYQRMRPSFSGMGASDIPDHYTPEMGQMAEKFLAARSGAASGVQSTYVNAQGQRVAIMRDGSQQVLGDANQSIRVLEQAGALPYGVVTSGGVAGQVVPLGGGQPPQGQQRAPGEVPFSIDPSLPPQVQASIRANESQWAQAPDMGSVQIGQPSAPSGPVRTPTAGEIAADQAQARADAEFRNYDRMTGMVADRASAEARARAQAEAEARERYGSPEERKSQQEAAKKLPQLQNAVRGIDRIDAALGALSGGLLADTGPLDQFAARYTKQGQELESAVGAIQNSMLALTRVPGVGSQSDLEQRVAQLQYPSLDKAPEVNARTMENLRAFVRDLEAAYGRVLQGQGQAPQQPVQRARNPQTGEVLELRNGQWVPAQ